MSTQMSHKGEVLRRRSSLPMQGALSVQMSVAPMYSLKRSFQGSTKGQSRTAPGAKCSRRALSVMTKGRPTQNRPSRGCRPHQRLTRFSGSR